ncbi:MAG TPA: hypothetical protein VNF04_04080 [Stellaceae bacterium]|nr:hypothetical protein [Stellaceae bacterium]
MTGADLAEEYLTALGATRPDDLAPLLGAGVPSAAIELAQPAFARITIDGDLYQPDPDGGAAFVLPVRVDYPETPETEDPDGVLRDGAIVDLLAMHPAHPGRWALRVGVAEWLGAVEPQYCGPDAVRIWQSPIGWLRSGCAGLVLLSRDLHDQYGVLTLCSTVVAENSQHAAELRRVIERPWSRPPVIIAGRRRDAA